MAEVDGKYVLVTEDDPDLRSALVELLELEGYVVVYVSTLEEARGALARAPDAVLLLDLFLRHSSTPAMGWLEDFERRGDAPRTLVLSGSTAAAPVAERFGLSFVAKPFDFAALLHGIERAFDRQT